MARSEKRKNKTFLKIIIVLVFLVTVIFALTIAKNY